MKNIIYALLLKGSRALGRVGGRPRLACDKNKVLKLDAAGQSLAAIAKELGVANSLQPGDSNFNTKLSTSR
jgi:hypothetical protein